MSLLVVGISHRSAPLEMLERVSLDETRSRTLASGVVGLEDVRESLVLATCNRTEVYADALTFHGAVAQVGAALAAETGMDLEALTPHLYVHYEDRAVHHLFSLACGLESMALGESEILGQLRAALRAGQRDAHLGAALNPLFQQALRVGKRAHTETGLDRVARSLVGAGIERADDILGALVGARALVVGAGAMSGLAAASLRRAGVGRLTVVNRTRERAERLATSHGGLARDWDDLAAEVQQADLVLSCTGATDQVITRELLTGADRSERPLVLIDLAMPRDVAPEVAGLPGVTVWGLTELTELAAAGSKPTPGTPTPGTPTPGTPRPWTAASDATTAGDGAPDAAETATVLQGVRDLVSGEVATYLATRRSAQVGPTLAEMRSRAVSVADAELARLDHKLPGLDEEQRAEVHHSVRRILDKLLHTPAVRAREMAADDTDGSYLALLRELFDLDPRETAAVEQPPTVGGLP
ncbi:glutamyl-tRNA reductase [Ornithinimicrobium sp. F0845]|uniref:glutamyl-tRNA reductase n=1 Tax=Ornithinimicrobium sp. F0845 TaxID=2926412 RepID=UPI001FF331FF|nr:glutamyl-tRNA reductase [Ornithinimicrobium sp. F0845]MCK0113685.1 glutamyl-tRNA reductase [Ornithinimicrobium sp. F0845]